MPRLIDVARGLTPPYLAAALRSSRRPDPDHLFDGHDLAFKRLVAGSRVYGEYGLGASTAWVARHTTSTIYGVDTSGEWVRRVREETASADDRAHLHWVDLGPLGEWGTPHSYDRRECFAEYLDWLWQQPERPDVVLIDGRFRVAAFLTTVTRADPGTWVVVDDYADRPRYHIVESVLERHSMSGRQALFQVPHLTDARRAEAAALLERFRYVMD